MKKIKGFLLASLVALAPGLKAQEGVGYFETKTMLTHTAVGKRVNGELEFTKNKDKKYQIVEWKITLNRDEKDGFLERNIKEGSSDIFKITAYSTSDQVEDDGNKVTVLYMDCVKVSTLEKCTVIMMPAESGVFIGIYTAGGKFARYYSNQ